MKNNNKIDINYLKSDINENHRRDQLTLWTWSIQQTVIRSSDRSYNENWYGQAITKCFDNVKWVLSTQGIRHHSFGWIIFYRSVLFISSSWKLCLLFIYLEAHVYHQSINVQRLVLFITLLLLTWRNKYLSSCRIKVGGVFYLSSSFFFSFVSRICLSQKYRLCY